MGPSATLPAASSSTTHILFEHVSTAPLFLDHALLEYLAHHSTSRQSHLYRTRLINEAHRLETSVRNAYAEGNHDKIARIVHQLVHDYAYAIHQPHARNGGLIGLAAAAIALGPVRDVAYEWKWIKKC
nr:vacuole morphology and inheritance protein 14 [Quercus suber]